MKRNNLLKRLIQLISLGIFSWYGYQLLLKYISEQRLRKEKIKLNTQRIEKTFLLREEGFYLNQEYLNRLNELKRLEKENSENIIEEGDSFEYSEEL